MRLIDADALIEAMKKTESEYENAMTCPSWWSAFNVISEQPTAYDVDKVVEELNKAKDEIPSEDYCRSINDKEKCDGRNCFECCAEYLIEIVKQGGLSNRKDCEYRHENGNCLKVGGFCTSVDDKHCEKIKQGGVSDDVCEWKYTKEIMDNAEFKVGCNQNALKRGIVPNNFSYHDFKYCPYCGKKIKVVE